MLRNETPSSYCFEELRWDTEYFGYKSAKVILKSRLTPKDKNDLLDIMKLYDFVTIQNEENLPYNNNWIGEETSAFLVDINCQFLKEDVDFNIKDSEFTIISDNFFKNEDIIRIAKSSFVFSRFYNDPYLNSDKTKTLYTNWVENSFEKTGKYFVRYMNSDQILGFLLFTLDKALSTATIELLAVDSAFKGRQVGKTLIGQLEAFLKKESINLIKVGTQLNNIDAMNFYKSCGYDYSKCNSIYHFWPKSMDMEK